MPAAEKGEGIKTPHDHDVLSGRGNFVNYHPGNEHFRSLVRKHKVEYVKCPKPQKGKFSKLIYDEVKARNPPGRFLKQDASTKLWYDIGEKKALDKTRQALREGAPELMKEMSGDDSSEDTDNEQVIARKKNPGKNTNANTGGMAGMSSMFPGDNMSNPFIGGFASPGVLSRNGMMSIGSIGMSPMTSPGLLSPGIMMTPDMQFSAQQMQSENGMAGRLHSPLSDIIPPPQVHTVPNNVESMNNMMTAQEQQLLFQQQQQQLEQLQQQMNQQQQLFLNANAVNNMGSNFDMMNQYQQQQQLQQMRIQQMRQQVMNNQMQQQQQQQNHQPQQMHMNQLRQQQQQQQQQNHPVKQQDQQQFQHNLQPQSASELRMLQNKLAAIYSAEAFDPRPIVDPAQAQASKTSSANMNGNHAVPSKDSCSKRNSEVGSMDNTLHADNRGRGNPRVEIPPGNNPRRMPPPSLLKRDDSLKMDKIFELTSPGEGETKKKYGDGHGSSAHLSAMSLSMGDLNDEGNLSQVFDSSLKISGGNSQKNNSANIKLKVGASSMPNGSSTKLQQHSKASSTGLWGAGESKTGDRSANNHSWENPNFDMSVATLGASEIGASEVGNMSYATLNMPDHEGQMSFSGVFEEAEK